MNRKLKVLGLAAVAVLAMSAFTAVSSAQAFTKFTWESGTTTLDGHADATGGNQVFTILNGLKVECNTVNATASVSGTEATEVLTSSLTYSDTSKAADHCIGPLGTSPAIEMNGCNYRFHIGGTVDIVCPEGKSIVINGSGCVVTVPAQTALGTITYSNVAGTKTDVTLSPSVSGIHYSTSGFLCGSHANETNGTYTGNVTVIGTTSKGVQTNISVS